MIPYPGPKVRPHYWDSGQAHKPTSHQAVLLQIQIGEARVYSETLGDSAAHSCPAQNQHAPQESSLRISRLLRDFPSRNRVARLLHFIYPNIDLTTTSRFDNLEAYTAATARQEDTG